MKLIKCKVASFGKLKNFEYDFSDGLNTIKEDNGWGKSTLSVFIKSMFYGLDEGKRSIAENERLKYKPWNSTETFGGSIEFERGGVIYRLERFFGNKKTEDSVRLFDARTGKEFSQTENLGGRIFQIDEEGFISTVFVSQKDFEAKSNTSLTAKFNEISETEDSEAFDKAVAKLEAKAKSYKYSGNRGIIPELKSEQFALDDKIRKANRADEEAKRLRSSVKTLEEETENLKIKSENLIKEINAAGVTEALSVKKENYLKAVNERNSLSAKRSETEKVLNGKRVDDDMLSGLEVCVEELNKASERERFLKEDVAVMEKSSRQLPKKSGKSASAAVVVLAALCAIIGVVAAITGSFVLCACGFVAAAVCGGLSVFLFKKSDGKENGENEILFKKKKELSEYMQIVSGYEKSLNEILGGFGADCTKGYSFAVREIKRNYEEYKRLTERIEYLDREIKELAADAEKFENVKTDHSVEELNASLKSVQEAYKKKADLLASEKSGIRAYEAEADSLFDYENRKAELSDKIKKCEYDLNITKTALNFLYEADENLKARYRSPLKESLNKYLGFIAKGVIADIDTDLKITIEEAAANREADYYSKGFKNLFEICKRFALTDVLFTAEKPFVILDDPFYNLDDDKLKQSLELIKKLSESYQIIYLVCHESRRV